MARFKQPTLIDTFEELLEWCRSKLKTWDPADREHNAYWARKARGTYYRLYTSTQRGPLRATLMEPESLPGWYRAQRDTDQALRDFEAMWCVLWMSKEVVEPIPETPKSEPKPRKPRKKRQRAVAPTPKRATRKAEPTKPAMIQRSPVWM